MRTLKFWIILLFTVSLISGCARYEKIENEEFTVSAENRTELNVDNVNGNITIMKADSGTGVIVKVEKIAMVRKKDMDKPISYINVDIDTFSSGKIFITSEVSNPKSIFKFNMGKNKVNYKIYVPEEMALNIDNVNGKIEVTDHRGNIRAENVNGNIEVKNTTGNNIFELVNGKFIAELDSTAGLNIETVNGSINLAIGPMFRGGFEAEWVNGGIKNEDVTFVMHNSGKKEFKGYIGEEKPEVKLVTVNGKINITKKK